MQRAHTTQQALLFLFPRDRPTAFARIELSAFDAGESALLEFGDDVAADRRRATTVGSVMITSAVTDLRSKTSGGHTYYRLSAVGDAKFGVFSLIGE